MYESFGEIQKRNPEPLFFEVYTESLKEILSFKHLNCVQNFVETIIPEMLEEKFIKNTELFDITENILAKEYNQQWNYFGQ